MSSSSVVIIGWDGERDVWLARREGEPGFVWVQDFADGYMSARSRDVELHVPREVYEGWVRSGDVPPFPMEGLVVV